MYIDALERNYYEYERLKGVNEEYERLKGEIKRGAMQITGINSLLINIGGPYPGACIGRQGFVAPYVQVETKEQLEKLIESYRYANERAREVQVIMFGVQK